MMSTPRALTRAMARLFNRKFNTAIWGVLPLFRGSKWCFGQNKYKPVLHILSLYRTVSNLVSKDENSAVENGALLFFS